MASHPQEYTREEMMLTKQDMASQIHAKQTGTDHKVRLPAIQVPNGYNHLFSTKNIAPLTIKDDAKSLHASHDDGASGAGM
jgi:hypothetical protein